jgi:hypothetical protein
MGLILLGDAEFNVKRDGRPRLALHREGRALGTLRQVAIGVTAALTTLAAATTVPNPSGAAASCDGTFDVVKRFRIGKNTGISAMTVIGQDLWTVGTYRSGGEDHNFLTQWDGDGWNWLPIPLPRRGFFYFGGIDASAPEDIWLAGTKTTADSWQPVIFRWTAGEWTRMHVPKPEHSGHLWDIEVISPMDAWAVGSWDSPEPAPSVNPLAYHWDGAEWTRQDPPAAAGGFAELITVDASSPTDVWSVSYPGRGPYIVRWAGDGWTRHQFPEYEEGSPRVSGIDAVSPTEVWLAGSIERVRVRVEVWRWNGTNFAETSTFNPRGYEFLSDVEMRGDTGYAVGNETRQIYNEALVLAWNGQDWAKVNAERPGLESFLGIVDIAADGTVWATGGFDTAAAGGDHVAMIQRACFD